MCFVIFIKKKKLRNNIMDTYEIENKTVRKPKRSNKIYFLRTKSSSKTFSPKSEILCIR